MKQYADVNGGEKLFRIINGENVIGNETVDLDGKIRTAQDDLKRNKSKLDANEFRIPDMRTISTLTRLLLPLTISRQ